MKNYHDLLRSIRDTGVKREDRTGVGTVGIFGAQLRFDLSEGFPLLTTKRTPLRLIAEELFWFLRGETNVRSLQEKNVHIWDEWADANGDLGPVYGSQWRSWPTGREVWDRDELGYNFKRNETIDQIADVLHTLRTNPNSRRMVVSAWNPVDVPKMKLPPCHTLFQFFVANGRLSCQLYQRSADMFLGVPFNIASYALLTHIFAHLTGLQVGDFVHSFGDAHIYLNHLEQVEELLSREPRQQPQLQILCEPKADPKLYSYADLELTGYDPYPAIKADVAV